MENHDVIIIGAGPAGLAAAICLQENGVKDVVVLEREWQAGGAPRHCGHYGFGWESHRRMTTGPKFAARMTNAASGIDIRTATTVLEFTMRNALRVHSSKGIYDMSAKRIILATGTREQTGAARFIGGRRLSQVMNSGTLQQHVYLKNQKPFLRPAIIGNEWVTFSALMTCKHAGIKPIGIFAEELKLDVPWFFPMGAGLRYGVPTHTNAKLVSINGQSHVESIEIERKGKRTVVECDGVILTGKFQAEVSLLAARRAMPPFSAVMPAQAAMPIFENASQVQAEARMRETDDIRILGNARGTVYTAGRCVVEARNAAEALVKELR